MLRAHIGLLTAIVCCLITPAVSGDEAVKKQVMELRTYTLKNDAAVAEFDKYAAEALIPALNRLGIKPVGAFAYSAEQPAPVGGATTTDDALPDSPKVMLLLPADNVEVITTANEKIAQDKAYQQAAAAYLETPSDKPLLTRINSELLMAFDSWPQAKAPPQNTSDQPRLYELRTYESPTEKLGHLKVEMFNSGEVPIFLDCGIRPVFMGQAVIGDLMPNLTYMTVYDNATQMAESWDRFREHPEWKKLAAVKKYLGTVSKIHKSNWQAKPYSQL